MIKTLIVSLELGSYRNLEEQARAAGTTLPKHASELLADLLEPPAVVKKSTKHASVRLADLLEPPVPKKKPNQAPPPKQVAQNKPLAKPLAKKAAPSQDSRGKVLRGLAVHSPARRSEIALKAAATRKRRAEEAARKRR